MKDDFDEHIVFKNWIACTSKHTKGDVWDYHNQGIPTLWIKYHDFNNELP